MMKKLLSLSVGILLTGLLISTGIAGENDAPTIQPEQGQTQKTRQERKNGQVIRQKSGISLDERYKKRIVLKKRAAEMRKKLLRENQDQTAR